MIDDVSSYFHHLNDISMNNHTIHSFDHIVHYLDQRRIPSDSPLPLLEDYLTKYCICCDGTETFERPEFECPVAVSFYCNSEHKTSTFDRCQNRQFITINYMFILTNTLFCKSYNCTHFKTFFLFGRFLTAENSQSLFESVSDSGNDSSNSEASSILVIPLVPNDDGSDDAVSRVDADVFGRCNGV